MADREATTKQRAIAAALHVDPRTLIAASLPRYEDALAHAAARILGDNAMAELAAQAERIVPGVSDAPAWDTLHAHLAYLALDDIDPLAGGTEADDADSAATATESSEAKSSDSESSDDKRPVVKVAGTASPSATGSATNAPPGSTERSASSRTPAKAPSTAT